MPNQEVSAYLMAEESAVLFLTVPKVRNKEVDVSLTVVGSDVMHVNVQNLLWWVAFARPMAVAGNVKL